ncbi:hypothetical protein D3C81_745580 [compost metagenome]|uniref:RiboL-PSP-HEPN domain-containing protein n=1 Tax=Acinetobacter oleivorans (strain JCM 16667 / KCTC 23045 / DR1) TaxID=436717 RepID=A0AAN0UC35_ACISD|nr:hypothetical protein [Acinetobacter oleivorans]ADI89596.1 hypothetical protein AOLE_03485 [Acinetobacter oleivorans DR1]ESK42031.1 hypothetical protein P254_03872 [Acinetobacter oleivorans CIP 110421]
MTSIARTEYFERISSIISSFERQHLYNNFLNELSPTESLHNNQARLLRNGLSISNFCFFEDFIKSRLGECLQDLPSIFRDFQSIPDALQQVITINALESIQKRGETIKRSKSIPDAINFIQENTYSIGSTYNNSTPYSISKFSLGWSKENINFDDYVNYLGFFHVKKSNEIIKKISSHLFMPILDPQLQFNQISIARHKAAHVPSHNISVEDLKENIKNTIIYAFIFDYCISYSMKLYRTNSPTHLEKKFNFHENLPKFRSIIQNNEIYQTHYNSQSRSIKNYTEYSLAKNVTLSKLKINEFLVFKKNIESYINEWYFNF